MFAMNMNSSRALVSLLLRRTLSTTTRNLYSRPAPCTTINNQLSRASLERDFSLLKPCSSFSFRFSSAAPSEKSEKSKDENSKSVEEKEKDAVEKEKKDASSDSDEDDISKSDLIKLLLEKEKTVEEKQKEINDMKDKFLRSIAEYQNVSERTKREAENSKKFAIQSFAKSLLDVADNLGRASSTVKKSFGEVDQSKDLSGTVALLKSLLEGVEMTEKQLSDVFKKYGVEKFDPLNESFDPNRHMAVFQVPIDKDREPGTVAVILKSGYTLHDRVIRPAEVGVVEAASEATETEPSDTKTQSS